MNYKDLLHKPFRNAGVVFCSFLDVFNDNFEELAKTITNTIKEFSLTTTTDLDKWGRDFSLERQLGETDDKYRLRLLDLYRGKGVTKNFLLELVNKVLEKFNVTASIVEWFEQYSGLKKYEFKVNVAIPLKFGYVVGYSGIGIKDVSFRGSILFTIKTFYYSHIFPGVREVVERYRASGTKAIYNIGGYDET